MNPQTKLIATIIWFAILGGQFIILHFAAGGIGILSGEMEVRSVPLFLVGFVPLIVGVIGRMLVIPGAQNDEDFFRRLVICLVLCETPAFMGMFVFSRELVTEITFAFVGSVLGLLVLFPLNIRSSA
jgi:hypothetical protein